MHKLLIPGLMFAAAVAASPVNAAAQQDDTLRWTRVVKFADLDLSRPAGAKTLYARLVAAAHDVCVPDLVGPNPSVGDAHCMEDALEAAVAGVNAPALTELFRQKHGAMPLTLAAAPDARR